MELPPPGACRRKKNKGQKSVSCGARDGNHGIIKTKKNSPDASRPPAAAVSAPFRAAAGGVLELSPWVAAQTNAAIGHRHRRRRCLPRAATRAKGQRRSGVSEREEEEGGGELKACVKKSSAAQQTHFVAAVHHGLLGGCRSQADRSADPSSRSHFDIAPAQGRKKGGRVRKHELSSKV